MRAMGNLHGAFLGLPLHKLPAGISFRHKGFGRLYSYPKEEQSKTATAVPTVKSRKALWYRKRADFYETAYKGAGHNNWH